MNKAFLKFPIISLSLLLAFSCSEEDESDPKVWRGASTVFTKEDGADWTNSENQDHITDDVWITRADNRGIFNIALEPSYTNVFSPVGTTWAFGSIDGYRELNYSDWESTILEEFGTGGVPEIVNQEMVLHLLEEDVYISITFLSWSIGAPDQELGGFSYRRSTE